MKLSCEKWPTYAAFCASLLTGKCLLICISGTNPSSLREERQLILSLSEALFSPNVLCICCSVVRTAGYLILYFNEEEFFTVLPYVVLLLEKIVASVVIVEHPV